MNYAFFDHELRLCVIKSEAIYEELYPASLRQRLST